MTPEKDIGYLIERYPLLAQIIKEITAAYRAMEECYQRGNKILVAGNGGSACDSQHIVAELMKGFQSARSLSSEEKERLRYIDTVRGNELAHKLQGALPAIALDSHSALNTAFANDVDSRLSYSQQVKGYGVPGDVFLAISTSGNSENIIYAAVTAKAEGLTVIGFTGKTGGKLADFSDITVRIPCEETFLVQELQLPVFHCWCRLLEKKFFS